MIVRMFSSKAKQQDRDAMTINMCVWLSSSLQNVVFLPPFLYIWLIRIIWCLLRAVDYLPAISSWKLVLQKQYKNSLHSCVSYISNSRLILPSTGHTRRHATAKWSSMRHEGSLARGRWARRRRCVPSCFSCAVHVRGWTNCRVRTLMMIHLGYHTEHVL